jgi:trk system potassium uptake protein TrkA
MENRQGDNVLALHRMVGGRVEALEFRVQAGTGFKGVPLKNIPLKPNFLVAIINHRAPCSCPVATIAFTRATPSCSSPP